ncbi:fibronectin type III domain-containing protein [Nitrosopumilus zosterae]|uniref:fibronectin type III domain-containing protein n=1 Tax=Nitrosopumilus zosterae TaxID=718286 RepID=UPI0021FACE1A|nr:fibronectin type III domain-containing protein [Nitrosopumilus zosterae]BDQ31704.1 fibronectin type III domain-containing protein [Nitrosopumilus zosterae]
MKKKIIFSLLFVLCIASIQIAHAEPEFTFKFGTLGSDDDELDTPTDLIMDKNGKNIYVVDNKNSRINVFEDDGDDDFIYGSFCDITAIQNCDNNADGANEIGDGQFNDPISIARDALGKFFVVDSDNSRIQIFDDDGEFQSKFGSSDSGIDEYLGSAKGIAIQESTKNILVSDIERDSVSVFDSTGDFLFKFDSFDGNDDFQNPTYMVIDNSEEMLYVTDSGNDRIVIFELVDGTTCPSGTEEVVDGVCFVEEFGSSGDDNGEFDDPSGLAFDSTNNLLYVADTDNNRIQIFEIIDGTTCPSGTEEIVDGVCFVEEFGTLGTGNGNFDAPLGITLDPTNELLFVADSDNNRIQAFNVNPEPVALIPEKPSNLKASPISPTSVIISWDEPVIDENVPEITGYKIEYKIGSEDFMIITADTASTSTSFIHQGLDSKNVYFYRVHAINSEGISDSSSIVSVKPEHTTAPAALTATAISPSQIKLSWSPPSETFGQKINGYEIKREIIPGVYDNIGDTNASTRTFIVSNLAIDKTYSFAVSAKIGFGSTEESNAASATPREDSTDTSEEPVTSTAVQMTVSTPPIKLTASVVSSTQINLSWSPPVENGKTPITGYKIEVKKDSNSYTTLVEDTESTTRTYSHTNLVTNTKYTYRVSAINNVGISEPSNEFSATPKSTNVQISPIGKLSIDEGKLLSFTVRLLDNSVKDVVFSLEKNPPAGAKIISNTGMFSWIPSASDAGKTHTFDVVTKKDGLVDRETITITVNDIIGNSQPTSEPEPEPEPKELEIPASFVDETKDPQSYVDRYNNEASYKKWFDDNFAEYESIYQAVGLEEPLQVPAAFVDETKDPQSYVDRYNNEASYKKWFDDNFAEYESIYQAVGLEEPKVVEKKFGICGPGTKLIEGVCTIVVKPSVKPWWQFW